MISYKEYKYGKTDLLIAASDSDLIGKIFHDKKKEFKLEVRKEFYCGSEIKADEFSAILKKATIANLVGEKTIAKAIGLGLVAESSVMKIQGIPHVQIMLAL